MTDLSAPRCPVVDFDPHTPQFVDQYRRQVSDLHEQGSPVAWTPQYGGAWLVSGMDEVLQVSRDNDTFRSHNGVSPEGSSAVA